MALVERIVVIVNPTAGGGKAIRRWTEAEPQMRERWSRLEIVHTERRGHATEATRAALERGVGLVVSAGGDGTANEVLCGFMDADGRNRFPEAEMGLLGGGTGGDFLRQLGSPPWSEQLDALERPGSAIDYGVMRFVDHDGRLRARPFLNAASAGLTGQVVARVLRAGRLSRRVLGPRGIYAWSSVREIIAHRQLPVRIRVDDQEPRSIGLSLVAITNGQYFGGGMWIAPEAELDDGRLEVLYTGDISTPTLLAMFPKIFSGRHVEHPAVVSSRGQRVRIEPDGDGDDPVLVELDGEQPGRIPAELWVVPGGLRLRVAGRPAAVVQSAGAAASSTRV
ncbi:MAG: hypothetical protein KDK70_14410 [Myxococcales bacterium]|nr:hypothetical protein [Myxococcales bacterium]